MSGTCLHAHIQPFSIRLQQSQRVLQPTWCFLPSVMSHFIWELKLHLRSLRSTFGLLSTHGGNKDNARNTRKPRLWHSERGINFLQAPLAPLALSLCFTQLHPLAGNPQKAFPPHHYLMCCKAPDTLRQNNLIAGITQPWICAGINPKIRAAAPHPALWSSHTSACPNHSLQKRFIQV